MPRRRRGPRPPAGARRPCGRPRRAPDRRGASGRGAARPGRPDAPTGRRCGGLGADPRTGARPPTSAGSTRDDPTTRGDPTTRDDPTTGDPAARRRRRCLGARRPHGRTRCPRAWCCRRGGARRSILVVRTRIPSGSSPIPSGSSPTQNGPSPILHGSSPTQNGPSPTQNGPSPTQNGPSRTQDGQGPIPGGSHPGRRCPSPTAAARRRCCGCHRSSCAAGRCWRASPRRRAHRPRDGATKDEGRRPWPQPIRRPEADPKT